MKLTENKGSVLLKTEENEQLFQLLDNRCQCLAAGICQLYLTEAPLHREWIKKNVGVITLIKDGARRSFYLRLYCLQRRALVWEHEVYHSMEYKAPLDYFHTFEAEDCMAAFNFANETDAITLRTILLEKLNGPQCENAKITLPPSSNETKLRLNHALIKFKQEKRDKQKTRLSKESIGQPSDFRHITHVGWNPKNGMQLESLDDMDPSLRMIINDVGISEKKMKRRKMQSVISDLITVYAQEDDEDQRILLSAPATITAAYETPPPIPPRTIPVNMNSKPSLLKNVPSLLAPRDPNCIFPEAAVPIRPVQNKPLTPRLKSTVQSKKMRSAPPPPPKSMPTKQIAKVLLAPQPSLPPPPPPFPIEGKVVGDEVATDAHSDLLSQIRQGFELKPVSQEPKSALDNARENSDVTDGGIRGALLRALKMRANDIHSDSEDSSSESETDDDWDD